MSYNNPINPSALTLKGIDKKIQAFQTELDADLSWLDKSFGLADRIVEVKDEKEYIYPAVFESNTADPLQMFPNDKWKAFCFWVKNSIVKTEDQSNVTYKRNPILTYNVSCIFYMDIHRIDNSLTYKETKSKIVEDILDFFNDVKVAGVLNLTQFIEDDITKIWDGFSIDQVDNRFKIYPKWACRLDFELSFRNGCYSTNSYTIV
jgi:hypothetical protein